MTSNSATRPLLDADGENRALRTLLNLADNRTYENLRAGLRSSGWEACVPPWALEPKGYVTTGDLQRWIRFILAQEQQAPSQ